MGLIACALGAGKLNRCAEVGRCGLRVMLALALVMMLAAGGVWAESIDLTDDQIQKLKAIAVDTRDDIERERQTLRRARTELAEVYKSYRLDDGRARALIGKISGSQKELLDGLLENQTKIRQILNAEQFGAFDKMIKSRMKGVDMTLTFPVLPIEEEVLGAGIDARMRDQKSKAGLERHAEMVKWVGKQTPEAVCRLRQSSKRLADMFSKYEMDSGAAKKVVDAIHRDQVGLSWMMHKRQQAIRKLLSEEQFEKLQQETAKKIKDAENMRRHRK